LQSQNYIVVKTESSPFDINIVKRKSIRKSATTVSTDLADERCPSGVEGLDDILAGGLPRDCFYLVQGDPGSGKTTLALQFLLEGVRRGEKFFYITLSETKKELLKVARSHGWSLDRIPVLDLSAVENLLRPEAQTTVSIRLKLSWPKLASYCSVKFGRRGHHGSPSIPFPNSD
jgi:predicted ATP-dependent serine protease